MARPKKAIKSIEKTICLPEDLCARVDLYLYSELQGRVPYGAWQKFITEAINEKLQRVG